MLKMKKQLCRQCSKLLSQTIEQNSCQMIQSQMILPIIPGGVKFYSPSKIASFQPHIASTPLATRTRCTLTSCSVGPGNTHAPTRPAQGGGTDQRSEVNPAINNPEYWVVNWVWGYLVLGRHNGQLPGSGFTQPHVARPKELGCSTAKLCFELCEASKGPGQVLGQIS